MFFVGLIALLQGFTQNYAGLLAARFFLGTHRVRVRLAIN